MLQIDRILVTRPRSRRPIMSTQLLGAVVDTLVDASVDAVADTKVTARSGSRVMIIRIGI